MSAPRKTKTSTDVKRRYNEKTYDSIRAALPKDTVAAFREKCAARGVSQASVLLAAVERFLEEA